MLTDTQREILPDWAAMYHDEDWETGTAKKHLACEFANTLLALKEAREVLKGIEWVEGDAADEDKYCPECGDWKWRGHARACKLEEILVKSAKVLGEGENDSVK